MRFATAPAAFAAAVAADPARPLITWYDDATGDRAELSGATCANWVAKTANLLVDGGGFGPGDVAAVDAPPHWQTAVVLLGCWAAGLRVGEPGAETEVRFVAADRLADHPDGAGERYGLALAPLAAPMRQVPPGWADFVVAVRAYGDQFTPVSPVEPDDPATTVSHRQLCGAAADRARALGIGPGGRVLVDLATHPEPLDWLLAPLLAGASTVLCAHLDEAHLAGRIATERVTTALTIMTG